MCFVQKHHMLHIESKLEAVNDLFCCGLLLKFLIMTAFSGIFMFSNSELQFLCTLHKERQREFIIFTRFSQKIN